MTLNLCSEAQDLTHLEVFQGSSWSSQDWGPQVRGGTHQEAEYGCGEEETVFIVGKESVSSALSGAGESGEQIDKRLADLVFITCPWIHMHKSNSQSGQRLEFVCHFPGKGPVVVNLASSLMGLDSLQKQTSGCVYEVSRLYSWEWEGHPSWGQDHPRAAIPGLLKRSELSPACISLPGCRYSCLFLLSPPPHPERCYSLTSPHRQTQRLKGLFPR